MLRARRGHDDVDLTFSDRQTTAPSRGGILVAGNLNQKQKPPPPSKVEKPRHTTTYSLVPKDPYLQAREGRVSATDRDVSTRLL